MNKRFCILCIISSIFAFFTQPARADSAEQRRLPNPLMLFSAIAEKIMATAATFARPIAAMQAAPKAVITPDSDPLPVVPAAKLRRSPATIGNGPPRIIPVVYESRARPMTPRQSPGLPALMEMPLEQLSDLRLFTWTQSVVAGESPTLGFVGGCPLEMAVRKVFGFELPPIAVARAAADQVFALVNERQLLPFKLAQGCS